MTKIRRQQREHLIDTLDVMERFKWRRAGAGPYYSGSFDRFLQPGEKMRDGLRRLDREFMALLEHGGPRP